MQQNVEIMKKIKILMVAGSMHVGGIENQLMHLARNVDKEKYQIDFTSTMPEAACREEIEKLGGEFILVPKFKQKPLGYLLTMYRTMKDGHYDVVHSHELFHSGITLLIARMAGIPCRFAHAHNWCDGDGTGRKSSLIRIAYNNVMRWLINTFSTGQIACSSWAGKFVFGEKMLNRASYHLVFNSVDTSKFLDHYDDVETGEFVDDGWINVINVARISAVKNQTFLAEIANVLKQHNKNIRILCAGAGDQDVVDAVNEKIKKYNIEDHLLLLGVRKDIDSLMRKCNAFVLPSHYEGMPLVMIEAQASGLQCISANTYSPEVDFGIGTVTWLSLDQSATEWAECIEKAVIQDRASKSEVQSAVLEKRFDSRMFASTLAELYANDVLNRGK